VTDAHTGDDLLGSSRAGPAAVRGGIVRTGGYVVGILMSVGSAALLFRSLGVQDGGRYVTVVSLIALFGGVTDAGLTTIAVREMAAKTTRSRSELMRSIIGLRLVLSALTAVAAIATAAAVGYPQVMVIGTALAGLGFVIQSLQLLLGASLMARLRFGWITALDLLRQTVVVGGIVVLAALGAGLVPFLALSIPAAALALAATIVLVRGDSPLMPSVDRQRWLRVLREVLPYAAATAVTAVYFRIAVVLVSLLSTEQETGYFGASFRVVEVLVGVPALAVGAAFPIFARAAREDHERLTFGVQRVLDASAVLGGLAVVGLFVGAPVVIDVVAGSDFGPAADVLRIQSIGVFASFIAAVWGYTLLSLRRHRVLLVLALVTLAINAALASVLAATNGAEGAAIATVVGEVVLAAGGFVALRRAIRPRRIRLDILARAVVCGGLAASIALLPDLAPLVAALLAGALYTGALWLVGGMPRDLLADLRGRG
jgi:O-antigen/teichoic acid export membrane protein